MDGRAADALRRDRECGDEGVGVGVLSSLPMNGMARHLLQAWAEVPCLTALMI
jgi:hypothetical protein